MKLRTWGALAPVLLGKSEAWGEGVPAAGALCRRGPTPEGLQPSDPLARVGCLSSRTPPVNAPCLRAAGGSEGSAQPQLGACCPFWLRLTLTAPVRHRRPPNAPGRPLDEGAYQDYQSGPSNYGPDVDNSSNYKAIGAWGPSRGHAHSSVKTVIRASSVCGVGGFRVEPIPQAWLFAYKLRRHDCPGRQFPDSSPGPGKGKKEGPSLLGPAWLCPSAPGTAWHSSPEEPLPGSGNSAEWAVQSPGHPNSQQASGWLGFRWVGPGSLGSQGGCCSPSLNPDSSSAQQRAGPAARFD